MTGDNVSLSLPNREAIISAFPATAIAAGATCPIVDPAKARQALLVSVLFGGRDDFAMCYMKYYRQRRKK